MIFHPEGTPAHYLWNGTHPILVYAFLHEGNLDNYVWGGNNDCFVPVSEAEAKIFNEAASTSRKSVFTINKRRYIIDKKGEFVCEET